MAVRHLSIVKLGSSLQLKGGRLIVNEASNAVGEYPLNRLKSVTVCRRGVSFSSNLLCECANRGIRFFILGASPQATVSISGSHQHAVVGVRRAQHKFLDTQQAALLASKIVFAKIRNQRAVLLYFRKYKSNREGSEAINNRATERLAEIADRVKRHDWFNEKLWLPTLLGFEGNAAAIYWRALREGNLLPASFTHRIGRGAGDVSNQCLNLGYAILSGYIWNALINAGLEPYAGCLHTDRPGKPSLVLDLMEEYRPWVVDRIVAKQRPQLAKLGVMNNSLKREIISAVHSVFTREYPYKGKKFCLETILQRQVYRLAGVFVENRQYHPYLFRW